MSWQDLVFGVGGLFFAASMLPTLRDKQARIPLATSLPTSLILAAYVVAEWTLGLYLAAIGGCLSTGAWCAVMMWRRPAGTQGGSRESPATLLVQPAQAVHPFQGSAGHVK